ncbi:YczE/YyaS/YitT family protein [Bergeriella denitrificans]|uniref:Uncharacterized BCR, YitT family COG1284 n=1 Tax=Bergeriella denitrificans TaxID=494 RepID=A0A378UK27_BERDE|nr:hypothetical protein [Bergeriella denitrificans]STZ77063.1 Uncharacterized BCR, YitT family COG1284 [Bergeriella denitrificans]
MSRLLPVTPWKARSQWSFEAKPLLMLVFGLTLFGAAEAMLVLADLGATPWVVFAQGLAVQTGWNIGTTTFLISLAVLLLWIPLGLRPGLGTLMNMTVIALVLGLVVRFVPAPDADDYVMRAALCVGGIVVMGVAAALYLTTYLGAGPRDGLMVGLCQKTGWRVGVVRTLMESSVCLIGWLLGGTLGIGTLLFAFGIGWVLQGALNLLARRYARYHVSE